MAKIAVITCDGHPALRANDHQSFEILISDEWTNRAGAIGYRAQFCVNVLASLRGRIAVAIACGGEEDFLQATVSPDDSGAVSLIFRRAPAARARCFAFQSSKAAADLKPALRKRMQEPGSAIVLTLTELSEALPASGGLFMVGMPIGNQADLSSRALDVLSRVDLIFAEDTRRAADALVWRGVRTRLRSCHKHNEAERAGELIERLNAGERIALISDAGMPGISDPGYRLVRAALSVNAYVTVVPGPSSILSALVLSGIQMAPFRFVGFPPRPAGERKAFVTKALADRDTTIWLEAGARVDQLLSDIASADSEREVALCRDLTKTSEAVERGTAAKLDQQRREHRDPRGEYVLIVAGAPERPAPTTAATDVYNLVHALVAEGCPTSPLAKALRRSGVMSRSNAYRLIESLKSQESEQP